MSIQLLSFGFGFTLQSLFLLQLVLFFLIASRVKEYLKKSPKVIQIYFTSCITIQKHLSTVRLGSVLDAFSTPSISPQTLFHICKSSSCQLPVCKFITETLTALITQPDLRSFRPRARARSPKSTHFETVGPTPGL